jgi:hypothetical protein
MYDAGSLPPISPPALAVMAPPSGGAVTANGQAGSSAAAAEHARLRRLLSAARAAAGQAATPGEQAAALTAIVAAQLAMEERVAARTTLREAAALLPNVRYANPDGQIRPDRYEPLPGRDLPLGILQMQLEADDREGAIRTARFVAPGQREVAASYLDEDARRRAGQPTGARRELTREETDKVIAAVRAEKDPAARVQAAMMGAVYGGREAAPRLLAEAFAAVRELPNTPLSPTGGTPSGVQSGVQSVLGQRTHQLLALTAATGGSVARTDGSLATEVRTAVTVAVRLAEGGGGTPPLPWRTRFDLWLLAATVDRSLGDADAERAAVAQAKAVAATAPTDVERLRALADLSSLDSGRSKDAATPTAGTPHLEALPDDSPSRVARRAEVHQELAEGRKRVSVQKRVAALVSAATARINPGDWVLPDDEALSLLREAADIARTAPDRDLAPPPDPDGFEDPPPKTAGPAERSRLVRERDSLHSTVGSAFAQRGALAAARSSVDAIQAAWQRAEGLISAAAWYRMEQERRLSGQGTPKAAASLLDTAVALVPSIPNRRGQVALLRHIASERHALGDALGAQAALRGAARILTTAGVGNRHAAESSDGETSDLLDELIQLARVSTEYGGRDDALILWREAGIRWRLAAAKPGHGGDTFNLFQIARGLYRGGDARGARAFLGAALPLLLRAYPANRERERVHVLSGLAEAQATVGALDDAHATAALIRFPGARARALAVAVGSRADEVGKKGSALTR